MNKKLAITNTGKTMQFPISVGELDIPDEALNMNYGGLIYLIEAISDCYINGKFYKKGYWYLGSAFEPICFHKKLGVYFQSSLNIDFKSIWNGSESGLLKYSILKILPKTFTNNDIRMEERRMYELKLQKNTNTWNSPVIAPKSIDTKLNLRLVKYTKSVVKKFMSDKEKYKSYQKKNIFYITYEDFDFFDNIKKKQTKEKEQSKAERARIKELLHVSQNYDKLEPAIVLKDFYGLGLHLLIDGNTTVIIMGEKDIPYNYVLWLEKCFYSKYGIVEEFQAEIFGNQYNRNEDTNPTIKVYTNPESASKSLIGAWFSLGWENSFKYTELETIANVNEILTSFNLLPMDYGIAIRLAKKKIRKKGKEALNSMKPDWYSDAKQEEIVTLIDKALAERNWTKLNTAVVMISASSMFGAYNKVGNEVLRYAKKGMMKVWGTKQLKKSTKKDWVWEKVDGFHYDNLDNMLFIVNCGQSEDIQTAFEETSEKEGETIPSDWENFQSSLTLIGNKMKKKYKILPVWATDLKDGK